MTPDSVRALIIQECDRVKQMLLDKNQAYGNSALDPVRIFSQAEPIERIRMRIDEKLARVMAGAGMQVDPAIREDTRLDLIGCLVLLGIAEELAAAPICNCKLTKDPWDPEDDWHFDRACLRCGQHWRGLHCQHDGVQNPCPYCGVTPAPLRI